MGGIIAALFISLAAISCSEKISNNDNQQSEYKIETYRKDFSFSFRAGSLKTMIITNAPLWVAEDNYSWITLDVIEDESDGKVLQVSVNENETEEIRKGGFDVIAKDENGAELARVSVAVIQNPKSGLVDGAIMFEDPIFEGFMLEDFDLNGDKVLTVQEVENVRELELENLGINSVEGIQYFKNLEYIDVSDNNIKKLDVSGLTKLKYVHFNINQVSSFKCDGCVALQAIMGRSNKLNNIDLSSVKESLQVLDLLNNELVKIDLTDMSILDYAAVGKNKLTSLSLAGCNKLSILTCNDNTLSSLEINDSPELLSLDCSNNFLNQLVLDKCTKLGNLDISGNSRITSIDLSKCPIIHFKAAGTKISSLQVGDNTNIETLNVANTLITELNISAFKNLKKLNCSELSIKSLNLSANTLLEEIICSDCGLAELDLTGKAKLKKADVSNNKLKSVDLAASKDIEEVNVKGNAGITLTLPKSKENDSSLKINKNEDCTILYR